MTTTATANNTNIELLEQLDTVVKGSIGQLFLSQGRCVDHLLDLYNLSADPSVRAAIVSALDEIRRLSAVRAVDFVDSLRLVAAVAEVESAFVAAA